MIIDVQQADIKTASVEIQSLTVSGKQLTLAVFRQLQEKYVLDDDAKLRGRVWGKVNYFWGACAKGKVHLHVVWQDGD